MSRIHFGTLSRPFLSHQKIGSPGVEQAVHVRLPAEAYPIPFPEGRALTVAAIEILNHPISVLE